MRRKGQLGDNRPLEPWEYQLLLEKMLPHWRLLYQLLWETGIRIGEALRLKRQDLVGSILYVTRLKKGKTGRSQRDAIPLSLGMAEALGRQKGARLFPYSHGAAWLALKEAAKAAGIRETIHPHLFRHSFGGRGAEINLGLSALDHVRVLARMMGHKDIRATMRYFQPGEKKVQEAWEKLGKGAK